MSGPPVHPPALQAPSRLADLRHPERRALTALAATLDAVARPAWDSPDAYVIGGRTRASASALTALYLWGLVERVAGDPAALRATDAGRAVARR